MFKELKLSEIWEVLNDFFSEVATTSISQLSFSFGMANKESSLLASHQHTGWGG